MNDKELENYCISWLKDWTGNKADKLINWYHDDAYYQDPAFPKGLKGHTQIFPYFKKLLELNPRWEWSLDEIYDTSKGFVLKWKAIIPIKDKILTEYGMDIVELKDGKIIRNEVYFDRVRWLNLLQSSNL